MEITFKMRHAIARLFTSIGKTFGKKNYSKLPLKNTRWDGTCNSSLGFLTVAHGIFCLETNDSKRVIGWK